MIREINVTTKEETVRDYTPEERAAVLETAAIEARNKKLSPLEALEARIAALEKR